MTLPHDIRSTIVIKNLTSLAGDKTILDDITLTVSAGERVCIMGANGSGKTTLIHHLNGLLTPTSGSVSIGGYDTAVNDQLEQVRKLVGIVFQDPDDQMVAVTVGRELAFGLENLAWEPAAMRDRVDETISRFGLMELRNRATAALSGGEQQRVAIAAVWIAAPEVLVLDEPTSMLDSAGSISVMDALDEIDGRQTVIHVTQSLDEAMRADRLVVLDGGRVVMDGPPRVVVQDRDRLVELGVANRLDTKERSSAAKNRPALVAQELFHTLIDGPNRTEVLKGVSFGLRKGAVLAITGPSGSGKTTCGYHANRLLKPNQGDLTLAGVHFDDIPIHELRRRVGLTFQAVDLQLFGETVWEDIRFGLEQQQIDEDEGRRRAETWLGRLDLPFEEYIDRRPATLSTGEKRRVALAGVLVLEPEVIVMDEPTAGLDARGADSLVGIVDDLRDRGVAMMIITHDHHFAARVADEIAEMRDGTL